MNPFAISGALAGGLWFLTDRGLMPSGIGPADLSSLGGGQRAALTSLGTFGDQSATSVLARIRNVPHDTSLEVSVTLAALVNAARAGQAASSEPYLSLQGMNLGAVFGGPKTDLDTAIDNAGSPSGRPDEDWQRALDLASAMDQAGADAASRANGPIRDVANQALGGIFDAFGGWTTVIVVAAVGLGALYIISHGGI